MHTDEYEISLLKEVAVCSSYILSLRETLQQLERKYRRTSDEVEKETRCPPALLDDRDRVRWDDTCRTLASWEKRKAEYEELHHQMKK
jgi:hypothetical protein